MYKIYLILVLLIIKKKTIEIEYIAFSSLKIQDVGTSNVIIYSLTAKKNMILIRKFGFINHQKS